MGRSNQDVGGYRGRRTITDILKWIAVALAVIVAVVLAGVLYLQRYVVYTDDGAKLELPPFLQMFRREEKEPAGSTSLPDPGSVGVVVQPDASQAEPAPEQGPGYAVQLTVDEVMNGTAAAKLEAEGAEAWILEMKAPSGKLAWYSEDDTAQWAEVSAPQTNNDALKQWNQEGVYTIARVCCFRDDSAPYSRNKLALRRGQYNWRDELGLRWLSPAHEESQAYIANLCGELGALGFDEIVLEHFYFPIQGNTGNINRGDSYDPNAFPAELEAFLTQVKGAVEPYGTKISLRFEAEVLTDEGYALSGVTAGLLDQFSYRFWSEQEGWIALSALSSVDDVPGRMVEMVHQAEENRTVFQAVIPEQ